MVKMELLPQPVRYILLTYLSSEDTIKLCNISPEKDLGYLQVACQNGKLNIAKWLQSTFNFTKEEAKSVDNIIFKFICHDGYLDIAKWFHSTFVITDEEARSNYNIAFHWACENKDYHVTRWLDQTFNLRLIPEQRMECL